MNPVLVTLLTCLAARASGTTQRPPIIGLSHIALFVHDVAKSRAFYKEFLGFDEPFSLTNKDGTSARDLDQDQRSADH